MPPCFGQVRCQFRVYCHPIVTISFEGLDERQIDRYSSRLQYCESEIDVLEFRMRYERLEGRLDQEMRILASNTVAERRQTLSRIATIHSRMAALCLDWSKK